MPTETENYNLRAFIDGKGNFEQDEEDDRIFTASDMFNAMKYAIKEAKKLQLLPKDRRVSENSIIMEYLDGQEGG